MNLYAYVANNPLRYVDPTGHMLSDIGVYQTAYPEVERRVARAEDQGIKNWVAAQQTSAQKSGAGQQVRGKATPAASAKPVNFKFNVGVVEGDPEKPNANNITKSFYWLPSRGNPARGIWMTWRGTNFARS
jgi:hypothetical protein